MIQLGYLNKLVLVTDGNESLKPISYDYGKTVTSDGVAFTAFLSETAEL